MKGNQPLMTNCPYSSHLLPNAPTGHHNGRGNRLGPGARITAITGVWPLLGPGGWHR